MSGEGYSRENVTDVTIEGREATAGYVAPRARLACACGGPKRVTDRERFAAKEGLVQRNVRRESRPVGQKKLQRNVLARGATRFGDESSERGCSIEARAGDRDRGD